ncbi:MAG: hypothetical protein B7Z33_13305 [Sphingomonadales bacterium 12-68-11]|nr:MAG: hypothetical protein B7Z33_13305 [Sphingomonadales bacterium 12-68-11]
MDPDEFNELFGLKPEYDIPPGARRAVSRVGVIDSREGGFPSQALAGQPAALVRAALAGTRQPLVSRWGHILLRRVLASRLDAPAGMMPVEFAALRAALLNRMGEGAVARALVQDVDSANFDAALAGSALDAYLLTGDVLGICPVAQLKGDLRSDGTWQMARAICAAYAGSTRVAERDLTRTLQSGAAPRIDVLLAQRYAGAAGEGRRNVTIEWDGVEELSPWRFALARALGAEIPPALRSGAAPQYDFAEVLNPAAPLPARAAAGDRAGGRGVLSSAAMVDLYSQLWADPTVAEGDRARAGTLREAYVAQDPAARLAAMRSLWGEGDAYGGQVLTAYAAARLTPNESYAADAPQLIAAMLAAGLDRNALRWGPLVPEGSLGWAMLTVAQPTRSGPVGGGAIDRFIGDDGSAGQRKSRFLVAGLAGLGRLDQGDIASASGDLGINLARENAWSRKIGRAAELGNPALVALLAGVGMQGEGWDKMTALHLFHIVRALDRVGLGAEARMIAAEAVARG